MIAESVGKIRERIDRACRKSGRKPDDVTLLAVSKTFPAERIREAVSCGIPDIGENYVQELRAKHAEIDDDRIRWHFIGHLQSNKVKHVADWIHLIHAVDGVDIAAAIDRKAAQIGRCLDILIEVNSTGEDSKFGVRPDEAASLIRSLSLFSHIRIRGLMTIGLFGPDSEASRPLYRNLRQLRDDLAGVSQENLRMHHLSMGMSGDYEVAIEEGATIIRLGTALFGRRKPK